MSVSVDDFVDAFINGYSAVLIDSTLTHPVLTAAARAYYSRAPPPPCDDAVSALSPNIPLALLNTVAVIKNAYTAALTSAVASLNQEQAARKLAESTLEESRKAHAATQEESRKAHAATQVESRKAHAATERTLEETRKAHAVTQRTLDVTQRTLEESGKAHAVTEEASRKAQAATQRTLVEALKSVDRLVERNEDLRNVAQHILQATHNLDDSTLNRITLWKKVVQAGYYICDSSLDARPFRKNKYSTVESLLKQYDKGVFTEEKHLYKPVHACLEEVLTVAQRGPSVPGVSVFDTHTHTYLSGLAPDISLTTHGHSRAFAHTVYGLFELKLCPDHLLESDENLGQVYEYLLKMRKNQPHRTRFLGVLSNIAKNVVLELEVRSGFPWVIRYMPVDFCALLGFLRATVDGSSTSPYAPPRAPFVLPRKDMIQMLGFSSRSMVAEFPHDTTKRMAVKCTLVDDLKTIDREIGFLRIIKERSGGHPNLPDLVHTPVERTEFGVFPAGRPFHLEHLTDPASVRRAFAEIASGLNWLHEHHIVHRDIRRANVVLAPVVGQPAYDRLRAVIIDFDHAVLIPENNDPAPLMPYEGGYICCPPELLDGVTPINKRAYRPQPKHDLLALILLVLDCVFPTRFSSFRSSRLLQMQSAEYRGLCRLWQQLRTSTIWGRFVTAAENVDVSALKEIGTVVQYPLKGTDDDDDDDDELGGDNDDTQGGGHDDRDTGEDAFSSFVDIAKALPDQATLACSAVVPLDNEDK